MKKQEKKYILGGTIAVICIIAAVIITIELNKTPSMVGAEPPIPDHKHSNIAKLKNPKDILNNLSATNIENRDILMPIEGPSNPVSHLQGYARYRGTNEDETSYDYHIFSHSNISGKQGYLYFISEEKGTDNLPKSYFYVKIPETEIRFKTVGDNQKAARNPHFNHPGSFQIVEDYLVIGIMPVWADGLKPYWYNAALIYVYDLRKLREANFSLRDADGTDKIKNKELTRYTDSDLTSTAVTKLSSGNYLLGSIAGSKLKLFKLESKTDLWNARLSSTSSLIDYTIESGHQYQSFNLVTADDDEVWVFAYHDNGNVDLYKLPEVKKLIAGEKPTISSPLKIKPELSKKLNFKDTDFRNAGSIEIINSKEIAIYSIGGHRRDAGSGYGFRINKFGSSSSPVNVEE